MAMPMGKRICIVGSGNWGSVIAKIVGNNVQADNEFDNTVNMYVYEEDIDGEKLTEIINTRHENVKYLPGIKLPSNVVAVPDVVEAAKDADVLVFVVPHQFVAGLCRSLKGNIKSTAIGISLIKGLDINDSGLNLISDVIRKSLNIECAVLMGANIAGEVAKEDFCEATIGCKDREKGRMLKKLMQTPYFRIVVVEDEVTVELCGALKNIVATGAGFVTGLKYGDNTKAAVIRLGLMEMVDFAKIVDPNSNIETFLESCGIADVITTCYSGRNARVAKEFAATGKSLAELEVEMLNGQKLQGPPTAAEAYQYLTQKNMLDRFPLFVAIHKICDGQMPVKDFIDCLKNHPEHLNEKPAKSM